MNLIIYLITWYGFEAIITSNKYWIFPGAIYSSAKIVDEIFILMILAKIAMNFPTHGKYISKPVLMFSTVYLLIIVISTVVNQVSPIVMSEYIIRYGKGLIIFIYCIMFLNIQRKHLYTFMKYFRRFFLLQFFVNSIWALGVRIIPNNDYGIADWAIGTLGNPFYIAIFTGVILSGTFYEFFKRKGISKKRLLNFVFIILCLIQLVWADTKHLFLVIPSILLIQVFILNLIKFRTKIIVVLSLVFIAFQFVSTLPSISDKGNYLQQNFLVGMELFTNSPKSRAYYHSFINIPDEVPFGFLGAGPGKGGSFIGKENNSYFNYIYFTKYNIPELRMGNTIMTVPYTGINSIQSELGILGIFLICIMILLLSKTMLINNRYNMIGRYFNHLTQIDFIAFFCLLLFLSENILVDLLQHSFIPILVWFFVAISYIKYKNINRII